MLIYNQDFAYTCCLWVISDQPFAFARLAFGRVKKSGEDANRCSGRQGRNDFNLDNDR